MRLSLVPGLFLLAALFASCAPPAPDVAQIRKTIEGMTAQMQQEMESGLMDTTMARYADDPVSMPNFGPMLTGKQAMKDYFGEMHEMGITLKDVTFTVVDVQVGLPYAYEIGTYKMTVSMPGMADTPDEGKYLTVWQKQADGSWKIKVETWNNNMRPPMPEM